MAESPTPSPPSLLAKLRLVLLTALVVVVECAVAWFLVPSPAETKAMAGSVSMGETDVAAVATEGEHSGEDQESAPQVELDLGQFSLASYQPMTQTTIHVEFHLWGGVEEAEQVEAQELLVRHAQRLREEVIVTVRGADATDLADPGLGLIKRRILAKSNRLFGKPLLRTVIFSDFSFVEQ